jgi:hypothetical protein
MNPQQRREYIATRILPFEIIETEGPFKGWWFHEDYGYINPEREDESDFESLPEWTGPICEVVFPILAKEWISIHFCESKKGEEPMFYLDDGSTDPMISLDRYMGPFPLREFTQRIVDAHIKITGEALE